MAALAKEYSGVFLHAAESSPTDIETKQSITDQNNITDLNYSTLSFFMNAVSIALMALCSVYLFNFQRPSPTHTHTQTRTHTHVHAYTHTQSFLRLRLPISISSFT